MAERKPISKKMRFEVFKRDGFRCQYCGRSAPDVILEVDHITPVSAGGKNSLMNLVTSCRDCNRGKGKTLLSDATEMQKQKNELDDLNERRKQLEMMAQWRSELLMQEETEVQMVDDLFKHSAGASLTAQGRKHVLRVIREFGFAAVYEAAEIAISQYCKSDDAEKLTDEACVALQRLGGICANRKRGKFDGY